ncbi:MAG: hypothetical protein NTZ78_14420 [Candidatus Aureabacteria bacterium]|nr:hypothetical protein [Candidatus Auribacterota bacterium]
MRATLAVVVSVMIAASLYGTVVAGNLDSAGAPSGGSGMYSLSQIYDYLNSGIKATPVPSFQGPGAAPGSTMKTTREIYESIEAKHNQCNVTAAHVEAGWMFFCTQSGSWGVQTGTLVVPPTPTPTITPTPSPSSTATWSLNAAGCNATTGWHWYTTNGRSACWSKTLADSVSWNKGVGNDSRKTGSYTCTSLVTYDLKTRMEAAVNQDWTKIITSAGDLSALAIADCIDGTKDLVDCSTSVCTGWSSTNTWLRDWAGAAGKSALPYLGDDAGTINDYNTACASSSNDLPLACATPNAFYLNRKACSDGDTNYSWAAACGYSSGDGWSTIARLLGYYSCSSQDYNDTSGTSGNLAFRVVARPAE